ncbi:hypothetical protein [Anaerocolumna jejuensis]|uniref:hypothetical protein n=1 Tax=Anaerocolumna jejuensis TaxID=259063 RepID=UPI003F7BA82A
MSLTEERFQTKKQTNNELHGCPAGRYYVWERGFHVRNREFGKEGLKGIARGRSEWKHLFE